MTLDPREKNRFSLPEFQIVIWMSMLLIWINVGPISLRSKIMVFIGILGVDLASYFQGRKAERMKL